MAGSETAVRAERLTKLYGSDSFQQPIEHRVRPTTQVGRSR
jgi:hypothetical protein